MALPYASIVGLVLGIWVPTAFAGEVSFVIKVDAAAASGPVSGRLIIGLVRDDIATLKQTDPNDAPIWDEAQPMFGADISGLSPEAPAKPTSLDAVNVARPELLEGVYRVAARLITTRQTSNWREDPGNLFSAAINVTFAKTGAQTVELTLSQKTTGRSWDAQEASKHGAELVEIRSKILSDFHGREVMLRACVVPPRTIVKDAKYAAVYEVPGFGGRHFDGIKVAKDRRNTLAGAAASLADRTYWITLDPESPNGHTLFAGSANNGPCGKALTQELIPAIEARFPQLATMPVARLLRGHSSGGWSTLWLATTYPDTFGACWSTAPDPVDFRRFQLIDLYGQRSAYYLTHKDQAFANPLSESIHAPLVMGDRFVSRVEFGDRVRVVDLGSFRNDGRCVMTVERECRGEDLLGPDNTSGQQWDSWWAVFGPRNSNGNPAALVDPATGTINTALLDSVRQYDIGERFRNAPEQYGPLFRQNIRLVVGTADNFYLNEAVMLLKTDLDRRWPPQLPDTERGYIEFVPGADHGTVFQSPKVRQFPDEMVSHLDRHGLGPAAKAPEAK